MSALLGAVALLATPARAQFNLSGQPINYAERTPNDAIVRLQKQLAMGDAKLEFEIYRQLWQALNAQGAGNNFRHLSHADRRAILEIMRDTKCHLPDYWQAKNNRPPVTQEEQP